MWRCDRVFLLTNLPTAYFSVTTSRLTPISAVFFSTSDSCTENCNLTNPWSNRSTVTSRTTLPGQSASVVTMAGVVFDYPSQSWLQPSSTDRPISIAEELEPYRSVILLPFEAERELAGRSTGGQRTASHSAGWFVTWLPLLRRGCCYRFFSADYRRCRSDAVYHNHKFLPAQLTWVPIDSLTLLIAYLIVI